MVLHEKCCAICLLIFFNKLCNDAISTTVLIFLPVRNGNVVINNLIILFHHKRSTAVQLNCIVVPSSRPANVYISSEFLEGSMAILENLCNCFVYVRRNYSSITAPGDNYYRSCFIYFTHVNDDDSSRPSRVSIFEPLVGSSISRIWNIEVFRLFELFEIDLIISRISNTKRIFFSIYLSSAVKVNRW